MNEIKDTYDVIVIGAGVGGLSAAACLSKRGYRVLLVDKNARPGGLCTTREVDGFRFDVAIHQMTGMRHPGQCGGINVACDLGRASGPFSEELVLARRPDVVLLLRGELPESFRRRWANVPAVQDDRCVLFTDDDLLQAGPYVPEALRELAEAIHGANR